jgi:phospholipid/cholesterol/gamma-HCH transport system ATP-binding protein
MRAPIIEVTALTIGWGKQVLQRGVSFHVERGEVFAILGGSGCGKSTLLRTLIGLESPLAGTIAVDGVGAPDLQVGRPRFGVVFQSCALFSSLTVGENVGLALRQWTSLPRPAIQAIVRAKLALVGLDGAAGKLPAELSGGMKKRAAIARALVLEPELLFLDEPSAGLDPTSAVELDELILTLNRLFGTTVVLVSHELPSIFEIARRCIVLDQQSKSVIATGDPRRLRDEHEDPRVHELLNRLPRSA